MSDFWLYFTLGLEHVLDWKAYDHVLFLIALSATFSFESWKRLLILVTLFTLGHTASLVLTNYELVTASPEWIEFLIPITILAAALYNLATSRRKRMAEQKSGTLYLITASFGLIHGFGFGRYFVQINDEKEILPLVEFALGIEVSQVIVVLIVLIFGFLAQRFLGVKKQEWLLIVSSIVIGLVIPMLAENWIF